MASVPPITSATKTGNFASFPLSPRTDNQRNKQDGTTQKVSEYFENGSHGIFHAHSNQENNRDPELDSINILLELEYPRHFRQDPPDQSGEEFMAHFDEESLVKLGEESLVKLGEDIDPEQFSHIFIPKENYEKTLQIQRKTGYFCYNCKPTNKFILVQALLSRDENTKFMASVPCSIMRTFTRKGCDESKAHSKCPYEKGQMQYCDYGKPVTINKKEYIKCKISIQPSTKTSQNDENKNEGQSKKRKTGTG